MGFTMRDRRLSSCLLLACVLACATAVRAAGQQRAPGNGPKATVIRDTTLYVAADSSSSHVAEIKAGRELVVTDHNGPWLRIFANTDAEISHAQDAPVFGSEASATPISGWMEAQNVVTAATPKGDLILFGEAASEEVAASEPHAPASAAQSARLLYQRVADFFPQSPWAPEAAWRTADIRWKLQKADVFGLPSAHEKDSYLREQIDDTEMRKIQKMYPHSRWSDLAAWDELDNKICGDWQGSTQCPEKESEMYEKYAGEHPDSPKAPQALYEAAYRQCVLNDMYGANGDDKKAQEAKAHAVAIAGFLEGKYVESDYAPRAASLIYKLQASIPIYGVDQQ
jgi:hypothetical protein